MPKLKWEYISYKGFWTKKRFWFPYGFWMSVLLFINDLFKSNKLKWTISYYTDSDTYLNQTIKSGLFVFPWILYFNSIGYYQKEGTLLISRYEVGDYEWRPYKAEMHQH